jgi:hypothetical protein
MGFRLPMAMAVLAVTLSVARSHTLHGGTAIEGR